MLQCLIASLDITQLKFGQLVGVTETTVNRWLNGEFAVGPQSWRVIKLMYESQYPECFSGVNESRGEGL